VKPFVGQIVQYRYKSAQPPLAAVVTVVHDPEWVSLYLFSEVPRWVPHVEFSVHCKPAEPEPEPTVICDFYGIPRMGAP
jgi:hypothetical protein